MADLTDGQQAPRVPARLFWVQALAVAPVAGAAAVAVAVVLGEALGTDGCGVILVSLGVGAGAASVNVFLCGEHALAVPLAVLTVLYGWMLAYEPSVRRMRPRRRMAWVLAGLAISAVAVLAACVAALLIFMRGDFLDLGLVRAPSIA